MKSNGNEKILLREVRRIEVEYRRDLQHSYLVWKAPQEQERQYPARMIAENHLTGLLDCSLKKMDDQLLLYYDITSRLSLAEKCRYRKLTGKELLMVIRCLLQTLTEMDEYLLPVDFLCLEMEYIYVDPLMEKAQFCYFPGETREFKKNFRKLMEDILPFLDHEDQQGVLAGYGFYHYAVEQEFLLEEMYRQLALYEPKKEEPDPEIPDMTLAQESVCEDRRHQEALEAFFGDDEVEETSSGFYPLLITMGVIAIVFYFLTGWYLWKNLPGYLLIWLVGGGIILLIVVGVYLIRCLRKPSEATADPIIPTNTMGTIGQLSQPDTKDYDAWTGLLSEQQQEHTQLLGQQGAEQYVLEEKYSEQARRIFLSQAAPQIVGSRKDTADVVVPARTVSRMHARLSFRKGLWYLNDLNSRNGTWVNGQELLPGQERELKDRDELRFADQYYLFRKL